MTKIAILPIRGESKHIAYCAVAGHKKAEGKTAGEALDALTPLLSEDESNTIVVIQSFRPDRFFDATERQRLEILMTRWRAARDAGEMLSDVETTELNHLVEMEVRAATARTAALLQEIA